MSKSSIRPIDKLVGWLFCFAAYQPLRVIYSLIKLLRQQISNNSFK